MSEKYKPSTEEIKKAEEMMTEKEKRMSDYREADVMKALRDDLMENLKKGKFELKRRGSTEDIKAKNGYGESERGHYVSLYGKIGEHEISIDVSTGNQIYASNIEGNVDGKDIDNELARELFNKYLKIANLQDNKIYEERVEDKMFWEDREKRKQEWMKTPEYIVQQRDQFEKDKRIKDESQKIEQREEERRRKEKEEEREKLKDIL